MQRIDALAPVEFRFTEPEDTKVYGDRWYRYAEEDLIRTPARELIELEAELGMPIVDVMNGMRLRTVLGELSVAWLGVRAVDPQLAGPFDDFNPMALSLTWRPAEGKAEAGTAPEPDAPATPPPPADGSQTPAPSRPEPLEPVPTVALLTSPVVD